MSDANNDNEKQGSFWTTVPGILTALATLVTALGGLHTAVHHNDDPGSSSLAPENLGENCLEIKGNIAYNSGAKIYHVPGDKDYEKTKIDISRGERFFCTESEAEENGWKRAPK